jgi:transposase
VKAAHARSDVSPQTLRISTDTKAKINPGEFSRGGKSRGLESVKALDHDMQEAETLIPLGILEVKQKQGNVVYGRSRETSDFIVDGFEHWWRYRKKHYSHITTLQIDLDNGPEIASNRTQFIKRMVDFADKHQLTIELVYYPPYHSKYNSVEHFWGVLERHWNGALLTDFETVKEWTKSMRWAGIAPNVYSLDKEYKQGVKLTKKELELYEKRLKRTEGIEKWSVSIEPKKRE